MTALAAKITSGMVRTGKLSAKISFICLGIKVSNTMIICGLKPII